MKKMQIKRAGLGHSKPKDLLKPFNFCCDINHQDPDTRYNMRIPPLITSLTNIAPNNKEGPDLKFRLQDIGKPSFPVGQRSGTHKVKSSTQMGGRGKRGRGPLRWYIEDEIALAKDIVARERIEKCKREKKMQKELLKAKKDKKRKKSSKKSSDNEMKENYDDKDPEKDE